MQSQYKNPIIVTGTGRSGTSTVAGILYNLGVYMGDDFVKPNKRNPLGYFENKKIVEVLKDPVKVWRQKGETIIDVIDSFAKKSAWGFKAPHVLDDIEFFIANYPDAKYIIASRPEKGTVKSMCKTYSLEEAVEIYERRSKAIEKLDDYFEVRINLISEDVVGGLIDYCDLDSAAGQVVQAKNFFKQTCKISRK